MPMHTTTTAPLEPAGPVRIDALPQPQRAYRRLGWILAAALFVAYALLQNPYWVRHGDSEAFMSIARSLARGEGFRFNGQPVSTFPPGWPVVLAGAFKLTT